MFNVTNSVETASQLVLLICTMFVEQLETHLHVQYIHIIKPIASKRAFVFYLSMSDIYTATQVKRLKEHS